MIDKGKLTIIKSPVLDNRFWGKLLRWRWWILILLAITALVFEFLRHRLGQPYNLDQINILLLVFPYLLIFSVLGLILLGLLETRSELSLNDHFYFLQSELRRELNAANDWNELAATLLRFITNQIPLAGLSLLVYNQITEKYEFVAESFSSGAAGLPGHRIPIIHGDKQVALLNLFISPDIPYPATRLKMFQRLAPEFALAIERIQLLRLLNERTQAIRKTERDHIARQLHDTISHDLAYLRLKLDQMSRSGHLNGLVSTRLEFEQMLDIVDKALEQIQSLMSELHEEFHDLSSDLVSHVRDCVFNIGTRANLQINFQTDGEPKILPAQMQRQVLYLVREILRNVEKHARAQNVTLTLNWIDNGLIIKISDDGQGFDVFKSLENDGHYGIRFIQEIVDELNGNLSLVSEHNKGTQVRFWLPW